MSGLLNRFFGKKQTKNKFKVYEPNQLKMIALKTRIILQKQMDMLFKNISQDDQKFKLVGTDPNQLYVLLKNIGEKVIEAESIKLYIEMMRKIEASSARIVQTNGDMAQLKAEIYWFQSVLWFRKSKEITYLEDLHTFGLNFFKGIDITEQININCEIFQLYPVTKYLKKKDQILPIKEILFYLQPYVSCNISQPTLDAVFIINNQDVNRKSLQRSGFNHSTINFPSKVPQNSIIPPNNSVLNNNNSGNFNIQQPTNHSYINMNVQTGNNNGNSMNIQANNQFSQFNINSSNLPLNQPNQSNINSNYNYNVTPQNYFNQNTTQPPNSNFNLPPPIIQPNNPQTSQLVDHKGNIAYTHSTTNPGYPNNNYNNINNNNNYNNNNNFYNNPTNYPTNNTTSFSDHNPFNSNPFNNNNNNNQIPPNYVQNYNSNNINSNVNNNNYNPVPYQQPEAIITPPNPSLNNTKKSAFSSLMKNVNTNIISNMNQLPKISPQTLPIPPTPLQVIQQKPIPHVQPVIEPIQVIQSKRQQIAEIIPAVVKHQKQQRYIPTIPIVPQQQEYFDVVEHQYQTNNDPKYQQIQLQTIKPVNKNKTEQQPKLIIDQVHPITPISNDNNTLNIQTTLDERQRQNNDFQYRQSHGNNMSINRQSQDTLANGKNWKNKIKQWQQKEKRRKAQEQIKRKIQEQESQRNRLILEQKRQVEAQLRRIRQEQETRVRVIEENERRVKEQEQSRLRQIEDRKRRAMEQQERIEREEQERQRQRKARIQERQKQMSERQNERQFRFDVDDEREEIDRGLSGRFSINMGFKANYDDQYGEQFSYEHSSDVKSSMLKFKGDEEEKQVEKRQQQPIIQPQNTKVSSNQVQIPQQSYEKTDEQQSLSIIRNNNNSQTQNPTPYKLFFYKRKETQ